MYVLNKYVWKFIKFFFVNDKSLKTILGHKLYSSGLKTRKYWYLLYRTHYLKKINRLKCKNHPATLIDFCVWCHWACSQRVTTFAEIRLDLSIHFPPLLILIIGQESLLTDYLAVISADVRNYFQYICWGCLLAYANAHVGEFCLPAIVSMNK